MAKRKASTPSAAKPQRRSRSEIDRNYFFGDVLIKTGVAVAVVIGMIALSTPFTLMGAIHDGTVRLSHGDGGFRRHWRLLFSDRAAFAQRGDALGL